MHDSVIVCHELMHHINRKKGKGNLMAVKIDLAKAYNKVEWHLLRAILQLHGFPTKFIHLIMTYISIASLSPALFTIFIDVLSHDV